MNIPDKYEIPSEIFQNFLIPLSYEETLKHCRAYHIKTGILVCSKDLWLKKIERVPINERQNLFDDSVSNGHTLLVQVLLKDKNVDPADNNDYAIRLSARYGYVEIVRLLLADTRVNPAANDDEAIIGAATNGYTSIVELLLADPRVNPAAKDNEAIIFAAMDGHTGVVKLLLVDPRVDPADNNNTVIVSTAEYGHADVVKLLFPKGGLYPSRPKGESSSR